VAEDSSQTDLAESGGRQPRRRLGRTLLVALGAAVGLAAVVFIFVVGSHWEDGLFAATMVNDTHQTVQVVQCGDSCSPDGWVDSATLAPSQSVDANSSAGTPQPWIVRVNGRSISCMTLYKPASFSGDHATFRISRALPLSRCH
jgi:hypothetical protein